MAFGICYVLGCNYRNVTITFLTGDSVGLQDFVYSVVFYTLPGVDTTALPAALDNALPSPFATMAGTVAYGIANLQGGALSSLSGVYPGTWYVFSTGAEIPPLPPLPSPPPPSVTFSCSCTSGYTGRNCSVAPG